MNILIKVLICLTLSTVSFAQTSSILLDVDMESTINEVQPSGQSESLRNNEVDLETLVRQALNDKFDYLKHNDLRDVMKHDQLMPGTSRHILIDMALDPMKYAGLDAIFYLDKESEISAIGPLGHVGTETNGRKVFKITNSRADRRKETILGVSYERIWDMTGEDKVFDIDLLLFIHSSASGGYYFRKINIQTTWLEKVKIPEVLGTTEIAKTTVKKVLNEIPLSDTDFELRVELATQKAVLFDHNHGITKVFPITAGALDVRSNVMDKNQVINSMSLLLPGRSGQFADFKFEDSVLIKRSVWRSDANQEARIEPSYYKGRPFIGIIDRSRIAEGGTYYQGYRQVGFHYQIDDSGLKRGFESHGCLRLQDHDLYVLDAIVNGGPKDTVPVEVKMVINKYKNIDSVYRRQKSYNKVAYSSRPSSPQTIKCTNKAPYPVRFFENGYHTVADSDCLTKVADGGENLQDVVNYFMGTSPYAPTPLDLGDLNHAPIIAALNEIKAPEYQSILTYTLSETFPNSTKWIGDLNQDELNLLLANLKKNAQYGIAYNNNGYGGQYDTGSYERQQKRPGLLERIFSKPAEPTYNTAVWPSFVCSRNTTSATKTNLRNYDGYCRGKAQSLNANTPNHLRPRVNNCRAFFDALLSAGCGYR